MSGRAGSALGRRSSREAAHLIRAAGAALIPISNAPKLGQMLAIPASRRCPALHRTIGSNFHQT